MRVWKEFEGDLNIRGTGAIFDSLADWLRAALSTIPGDLVEIEVNLGGLDEAGNPSPDLDWVGMVAAEFPHLQVRTRYQIRTSRQEAIAPYEVCVRWAGSVRRAWVEVQKPGRWTAMED